MIKELTKTEVAKMLMKKNDIVELLVTNDKEKPWRKVPINCVDWRKGIKRPFESCGLCWEYVAIEIKDKQINNIKSLTKNEVSKIIIEAQGEVELYVSNTKGEWDKNKEKISSIDFEKGVKMPFWSGIENRYKYVGIEENYP